MARHINTAGLELIKGFEGLRLEAYDDGVGTWTIGYGHTAGVKKGDRITRSEADTLLRADLFDAEQAVERLVKVPLWDNEFSALVSLVFNIGAGAFGRSSVLRHLNNEDLDKAADAFLLWNKGTIKGKKVELKGLTRRRKAERELFLSDNRTLDDSLDSATPTPAELPTESPNLVQSGTVSNDGPPAKPGEPAPDVPAKSDEAVVGGRPGDPAIQASTGGVKSLWTTVSTGVLGVAGAIKAYMAHDIGLAQTVVICVTIVVVIFLFRQLITDAIRMWAHMEPNKYNIK